MEEKPPEDEPGAQERFDRGIANALKMPPQHHVKKTVTESPDSGKKRAAPKSRPSSR
jgi:hypothetical protein